MPIPAAGCAFCPNTDLTHSHIWPEWAQKIVPATATHYEITTGYTFTFTPRAPGPLRRQITKPGNVAKRAPRNTCESCNGGWMRHIEESAQHYITALIRGDRILLPPSGQYLVSTFLGLVAIRIAISNQIAKPIPASDSAHLMSYRHPPRRWLIWLMNYRDETPEDYWFSQFPMAMKAVKRSQLSQPISAGPEDCNTQVTTLLVGKMCAHLFSSTVYDDFRGYLHPPMTQIWPPAPFDLDTGHIPEIATDEVRWMHETIARERDAPNAVVSGQSLLRT